MNPTEENDPVDALLRAQNPYIDDDGFTARVSQSLPRRRRAWWRPAILLSATAIGAALALRWLPWNNLPRFDLPALLAAGSQTFLPWLTVVLVVATLVRGVISALRRED